MISQNYKIVEIIFRKHLKLKRTIKIQSLKYGQNEWDSIMHMTIIAELEKKLKTIFDIDDVIAMNSFLNVVKIIENYKKK